MIDALIQTTLLFAVVALATRLLKRRAPASLRHMLWAFAIVGALAVPAIAWLSPLEVSVRPAAATPSIGASPDSQPDAQTQSPSTQSSTPSSRDTAEATSPAPIGEVPRQERRIAWFAVIAAVWGIGALVLLARMVHGLATVHRIAARASEVTDPQWIADIDRAIASSAVRIPVEVRTSRETPVPYTCGLRHPVIVLPLSASEWNAERRDAVLLHELAHISRGDLAMNILSHVTRALYWINPLAWLAANGLRYEGERAADDAVLRSGAKASDYADHLLDIVKSVGQPVPRIALAMARSSDFEGRLLAILEPGVPRTRLSRARSAAVAALFVVALVPLTAMTTAPAPVDAPAIVEREPVTPEALVTPAAPVVSQAPPVTEPTIQASEAPTARNATALPPASSAVSALGDMLIDSDTEVRLAAVNSLGALQDPAAIAALAKALREDTDARVREAAAWALGEIDDTRAVPHLLEALKSERMARVRVKIVEALGQIDDPGSIAGVSAVLKDPSAEVRRAAVDALSELDDPDVIPALTSLIRDEDTQVRRNVASALGSFDESSAVMDALKEMARDRDAEVRANAIEGLSSFESSSLVPIFVAALKDSSAHVREHAADALGSVDELRTAPAGLMGALRDANRDVRRAAAGALGSIGDEAAVPPLQAALADTDIDTRRAIVEALKEIGGPVALNIVVGLLKDPDPEIRRMAAEALGRRRP